MSKKDSLSQAAAEGLNIISEFIKRIACHYKIYPVQSSDLSEVVAFFKAAYADQFNASEYKNEDDIIKRWKWANIENPNRDGLGPLAWICRENSSKKIIGHFGVIPIALKCKDRYYPAVWGRDLVVLPEFRKLGLGPFLVAGVLKELKNRAVIFLAAGVRDHVYPMYKKFGFADMGLISLYVRVNCLRDIIRSKINNRLLASLLSILGNLGLKIVDMPVQIKERIHKMNSDISIEQIECFDNSFDKLWETASVSFGLIARRDSAYLNWRFIDQPYWNYKIFKALRKDNSFPSGYIILREGVGRGLRTGVITDLFASANDLPIIKSLIYYAISYFRNKDDIALIRCNILNKEIAGVIRGCGFMNIPCKERFMFTNIENGLETDFFSDRRNWFVDYADSDLDLSGSKNSK